MHERRLSAPSQSVHVALETAAQGVDPDGAQLPAWRRQKKAFVSVLCRKELLSTRAM
jgi:hypothetical protein